MVLATIATAADYDDGALLQPLLEKQKKYLSAKPNKVVADSSYGTRENILALEAEEIHPYLKRRPGRKKVRNWLEELPAECDRRIAEKLMRRRLHTAEGRFAEAHVRYDHRRCRWRRRWRVQVQCYLVAVVQNIGKLLRYGRWPRPAGSRFVATFQSFCSIGGVFRSILNVFAAGLCRFLPIQPFRQIPSLKISH